MKLKIAAFNVENLFSRPKAMSLENHDVGAAKLRIIAELQDALDEEAYDKPLIARLAGEAHGYFTINKTRGQNPLSYSRETKQYKVNVKGRGAWDGFVDLVREGFTFETVQNTGALLRALDADIVGLCEVEDSWALRRFRTDQLQDEKLRYDLVVDGNDPRRIDVALLSRFPYGCIHTHAHETVTPASRERLFSRDCLEAQIELGGGKRLSILQNHFKSKLGAQGTSDKRRAAQALRVREILDERYDLDKDLVIVCGDLNDTPDSTPLQPLLSTRNLIDALTLQDQGPDGGWTYYYGKEKAKNQIDYMLVSKALAELVTASGVDRRGIAGIEALTDGRTTALPGVTSWRNAASDHGAVWIEVRL